MSSSRLTFVIILTLCLHVSANAVFAKVTPEQRKAISSILKDSKSLTKLASKKKFDELETELEKLDDRIKELGVADEDKSDRTYKLLISSIERLRARIPVSFEESVGPILKKNCFNCHSTQAKRGNLVLDTFNGLRKAAAANPAFIRKSANQSLLALRLIAPDKQRIPKGKAQLPQKDIQTIANWINQGAKFDGIDEMAVIGAEPPPPPKPPAKIVMADGSETVSFSKDIAPFMSNLCLRCHRGNDPRGGFSMETFEKLMQGGDSGVVVHGGDLDASRMWDLAGKQKPIKMPPGQALITRSNHANLKKWIQEGARFDGNDPKAPLSSLVPSAGAMAENALANMSDEEFETRRKEQASSMWKKVMTREDPKQVESAEFLIVGNVSEARLNEVLGWSNEHAASLRSMFKDKKKQLWRGKLIVFVTDDRFSYEEFNQVLLKRRTPRELTGHSVVTGGLDEAYVVVQDVGDTVASDSIGMKLTVIDHLTGAFLKRGGGKLPDWLVRGTGLVMAGQSDPKNAYLQSLPVNAARSIKAMGRPNALFNDGTFSPGEIGGVGYAVVSFLLNQGGSAKFGRLVKQINEGAKVNDAFKNAYNASAQAVAERMMSGL